MNVTTLLGVLASLVLAALPVEAALAAGIQALNVPAQGSSPTFVWGGLVPLCDSAIAHLGRPVRSVSD